MDGFAKTADGPYSASLALAPELNEFAPTLAIWVNYQCSVLLLLADAATPQLFRFDEESTGLVKLRVKQVFLTPGDTYFPIDALVGLY